MLIPTGFLLGPVFSHHLHASDAMLSCQSISIELIKRLHCRTGMFLAQLETQTVPGYTCCCLCTAAVLRFCLGRQRDGRRLCSCPVPSLHAASDTGVTFLTEVTTGSALSHWCLGNFKNFYCALSALLLSGQWGGMKRNAWIIKGSVHPN